MMAQPKIKMNIVMPMAGLGSRFKQAGYATPKPLIDVLGKPMYAWATDSLPLEHAAHLIFVILKSQPEYRQLFDDITSRYAQFSPEIISIEQPTRGQSETVLAAQSLIDNETPVLVHNADTAYAIDDHWLVDLSQKAPDGALLVFDSCEKRWSFSREDENGRVVEVREKEPISYHASTGTYYFSKGSTFVRLASKRINSNALESGEFYIAPLYNDLIAEGGHVKNYTIQRLFCFGTPEDLAKTLSEINAESPSSKPFVR